MSFYCCPVCQKRRDSKCSYNQNQVVEKDEQFSCLMSDGEKKIILFFFGFRMCKELLCRCVQKNELNSFGNWAEITYIQIQMCLFQVSSNKTVSTL